MIRRNKLTALFLIYSIWLHSFVLIAPAQNQVPADDLQSNTNQPEPKGLRFRLSEGTPQTEKQEVPKPSTVVNLNAAEAEAIFRRLPEITAETVDKADFTARLNSLPPPKVGSIISAEFPAVAHLNAPNGISGNSEKLEVVRFSPDGNIPLVTDLSVTFSQPMTVVASQTETAQIAPVVLSPNVKGKWRWLGTKTLIFDAESRFPMATKFTATIPAGTKSATGGVLSKDVSWTFSTPAPKVESFIPNNETVKRSVILLASFNQEINREAVLQKISAAASKRKIALRLANQEEIAADEKILEAVKKLLPNRWIAFRAVELLPADSPINVTFEIGTPSAEGVLTTTTPQAFSFKTFGGLKFAKSFCGYHENSKECKSHEDLKIEFNNSLDAKTFDKSQVVIEPNIENAEISVDGNQIVIGGCCKKTRTNYTVTIKGNLRDKFGQTLGKDVSAKFRISPEVAALSEESRNKDFIVLDPNGKQTYSVYSTNYRSLKVKLYAVRPEDYRTFYEFKEGERTILPTFGKLIYDKTIQIKSAPDESIETPISIKPALTNGFGHAVLIVEPPVVISQEERIVTWLEATQIGVDGYADYEQLSVFASDLKSGKSLGGVNLETSDGANGVTDKSGIANLAPPPLKSEDQLNWLIARRGDDSAILLGRNYNGDGSWSRETQNDALRWFVFNDRNVYRPGETVSIKGYLRKISGGKYADVGEISGTVGNLNYVLKDSRGNEITRGKADLNDFGAFDFQLNLPENINLGYQRLEFTADSQLENKKFTHNFQAQEFRRPEFEVSAAIETPAPFYVGDSATVGVEAKYYSGGFLINAETDWNVTAKPTNYTPPNRDDYTFGKFVPWWKSYYDGDYDEQTSQQFKGVTDSKGKHRLAIDFEAANPARPFTINAEARVQDVNRQTFAASTDLLVHPSKLYVGIRTPKTFVGANESFKVETITTDIDGNAVSGANVTVIAELKNREQIKGEWQEVTVDTQSCQIISGADAAACDFAAKQSGTLTIKASVLDDRERRNESELTVWVAGAGIEPSRDVEQETVELIPNKKDYAPNETAEILVNSPFVPAEGVLTLRRNGIVKVERFTMDKSSIVLRIPIEERYLPNINVQVDLVGASKRIVYDDERDDKLPKRPAYASGELNLDVSTASRKLTVTAEPSAKTLEPGGATTINVAVKDNNGNAVAGGEVAIIAVDESVLALTGYKIPDPLDAFYQQFDSGTADYHSRENVLLSYPDDIGVGNGYGSGSGNGNGNGSGSGSPDLPFRRMEILTSLQRSPSPTPAPDDQIKLRTNFNALAIFSPSVKTDANGKAVVNINLPDNLTRYRITAVAVTGSKQFGTGESAITAKQPLMVRPSAPRFMNFGDQIELPVVLQNQTDKPLTVDVAIRATNAVLTDGNGRKVTIAANDRAEIRFPVIADKAGTARFQIGATSGSFADAAEFEMPVYTPATSESFATYGTTEQNGAIVQPISAPSDVFPQFGGLEITTSSTQLQELTDAFIYLQNYPFECSEQIASRILSVAALRDVLTAFEAKELPSAGEIEAKMKSDIERLRKLQHGDGGFSFWRSDDASVPFVSVHVAHALARAIQKGYNVPPATSSSAANYLKNIEAKLPASYSQESRWAISAYALYVRGLLGDQDAAKARKLLQNATIEKLSPESIGWILSVIADDKDSVSQVAAIKRHLLNRATETASAAHFVTNYTDGEYVLLSSERRADAVILEALLKADPNNDLIPKIVRGLLANKTSGRWKNTQENVFVLLALDKYFHIYERTMPDFVAKVWLGEAFAGERKFAGRSIDSSLINVPMNRLQKSKGTSNLILDKQGGGRLYYRIGMNYAPKNLNLPPADYGFTVLRTYEAIDDAADVKRNADGSWTIKSGARIRVKVQMIAPTRRYHVALVDKLPAGLEIINSNLAVSESIPSGINKKQSLFEHRYSSSSWYDHQNLRDERAEVFTSLLREGVWSYSYFARATTPGNFVAPPAKAEEMYAPETFGRSGTDFVKVQ